MNERIKELADKATSYCDTLDIADQTIYQDIWKREFAELIVRECAEACMKRIDIGWATAPRSPWMAKQILEHFGIEE